MDSKLPSLFHQAMTGMEPRLHMQLPEFSGVMHRAQASDECILTRIGRENNDIGDELSGLGVAHVLRLTKFNPCPQKPISVVRLCLRGILQARRI